MPWFLESGGSVPRMLNEQDSGGLIDERMRPRVGYAFLYTFLHQGRRYGLSADLKLLPTDRLRPIRGSEFHGVEIGKQIEFPVRVRTPARCAALAVPALVHPPARRGPRAVPQRAQAHRQAAVLRGQAALRNQRRKVARTIATGRGSIRRSRMPAWGKNGEKWIDVNLTKQTIVLYEGTKPVYATLISSGEAGLEDHEHSTATKRGIFRIHTKHLSATMSSAEVGEEFELREVPYVQYFDQGYAMHGAYWHDRFGIPKSHGCINLAPEDARRIFSLPNPRYRSAGTARCYRSAARCCSFILDSHVGRAVDGGVRRGVPRIGTGVRRRVAPVGAGVRRGIAAGIGGLARIRGHVCGRASGPQHSDGQPDFDADRILGISARHHDRIAGVVAELGTEDVLAGSTAVGEPERRSLEALARGQTLPARAFDGDDHASAFRSPTAGARRGQLEVHQRERDAHGFARIASGLDEARRAPTLRRTGARSCW